MSVTPTDDGAPTPIPIAKETKLKMDKGDHAFSILEELDAMRKDGERCDFKVKLGEDTMDAHRTVLSASSKYFKAMMSHDTLESRSGVVEFRDCDLESVRKCIDFIYTGEACVEEENCEKLMHVAHMMQLERLCDGIGQFLVEKMTPKSFFRVKKLAQTYELADLDSECDQFAQENLGALSESGQFKNMQKDYILSLITSTQVQYSENAKCKILIRWLSSSGDHRRDLISEILEKLDISQMSQEYKLHLVQSEPLLYSSPECLKMFYLDLTSQIGSAPSDVELCSSVTRRSKLAVFESGTNTLQAFDPTTGSWDGIMEVDESVVEECYTTVILNQHIYLLGSNSMHRLVLHGDASMEQMAELPYTFDAECAVVVFKDFIYIFRVESQSRDRYVHKFNPFDNKWIFVSVHKTQLDEASYVACQQHIYSVGGKIIPTKRKDTAPFGFGTPTTVQAGLFGLGRPSTTPSPVITQEAKNIASKFDPLARSWKFVKCMTHARSKPAVAEYCSKIYALGGSGDEGTSLNYVECYSPAEDTWVVMTPMLNVRSTFKALMVSGVIYVVGGNRMQLFDIEENSWQYGEHLDDMKIVHRLAVAI